MTYKHKAFARSARGRVLIANARAKGLAWRREVRELTATLNAFCPTGPGGGKDNSCGVGSGVSEEGWTTEGETTRDAMKWRGWGSKPKLTGPQKSAVGRYQTYSNQWNNGLRAGDSTRAPSPKVKQALDSAISDSPLGRPYVVYRGVPDSLVDGLAEGSLLTDKGYSSTSPWVGGARHYGRSVLKISVPKGTPALMLDDGPEMILGRGATFRVDRREDTPDGAVVHVTVVKQTTNAFCPTGPGGGVDPTCSPKTGKVQVDVNVDKKRLIRSPRLYRGSDHPDPMAPGPQSAKGVYFFDDKNSASAYGKIHSIGPIDKVLDTTSDYGRSLVEDIRAKVHQARYDAQDKLDDDAEAGRITADEAKAGKAAIRRRPEDADISESLRRAGVRAVKETDHVYYLLNDLTTNAKPKPKPKLVNPLRLDPSHTGQLRKRWEREMGQRFDRLKKALWKLVVEEDALGLGQPATVNAWCPTGKGGGKDNSCSPGQGLLIVNPQSDKKLVASYGPVLSAFMRDKQSGEESELLTKCDASKGKCDSVASELVEYLNGRGVKARVVGATGLKPDLPDDAHPEWRSFVGGDKSNQDYLWHAVVQTEDAIIDLTGSQYGAKYAGVRVLKPSEFKKEWKSFKIHPKDYTQIKPVKLTETWNAFAVSGIAQLDLAMSILRRGDDRSLEPGDGRPAVLLKNEAVGSRGGGLRSELRRLELVDLLDQIRAPAEDGAGKLRLRGLRDSEVASNAFCPTGKGGGKDNSCSPKGGGVKSVHSEAELRKGYKSSRQRAEDHEDEGEQPSLDEIYAMAEKTVEEGSLVVFHGTADLMVQSIKKHGLIPAGGPGADAWAESKGKQDVVVAKIGDREASVYVADDPLEAATYAAKVGALTGTDPMIIRVRIPAKYAARLTADELAFRKDDKGNLVPDPLAQRFPDRIPPDWIESIQSANDMMDDYARAMSGNQSSKGQTIYVAVFTERRPTVNQLLQVLNGDCGTGKGGFKPGNTCGKGGGSSALESTVKPLVESMAKYAADSRATYTDRSVHERVAIVRRDTGEVLADYDQHLESKVFGQGFELVKGGNFSNLDQFKPMEGKGIPESWDDGSILHIHTHPIDETFSDGDWRSFAKSTIGEMRVVSSKNEYRLTKTKAFVDLPWQKRTPAAIDKVYQATLEEVFQSGEFDNPAQTISEQVHGMIQEVTKRVAKHYKVDYQITPHRLTVNQLLQVLNSDCGTGKGGFKPGNTCGKGGGNLQPQSLDDIVASQADWWKGLSDSERGAVESYHHSSYAGVQALLRGEKVPTIYEEGDVLRFQQYILGMDSAFEKVAPLGNKVTVERSLSLLASQMGKKLGLALDAGKIKAGSVIEDAGYQSTYFQPNDSSSFIHGKLVLRFEVPVGTKAIARGVYQAGHTEITLPRGAKYKISKVEMIEGGRYIIHAMYSPTKAEEVRDSFTTNADCGTGAGGFKPGNTCGKGGGKVDQGDQAYPSVSDWPDESGGFRYFYHATDQSVISSIGREGLARGLPMTSGKFAGKLRLSVSTSVTGAREWLPELKIPGERRSIQTPILLRIKSDSLDSPRDVGRTRDETRITGPIDPKRLEVYTRSGWKSLVSLTTNAGRWAFLTSSNRLEEFVKWFKVQLLGTLLEPVHPDNLATDAEPGESWLTKYIREAYKKSLETAHDLMRPTGVTLLPDAAGAAYQAGGKAQFMRQAFNGPAGIERVRQLAGRAYDDLEGISTDLSNKISHQLLDGMVKGESPRAVGRRLNKMVDGYKNRGEAIAVTEPLRAFNEGQLDGLEQLGATHVGAMVEWSTSGLGVTAKGYPSPCPLCAALQGVVFTIQEAHGLLPRHPRCLPGDSLVTSSSQITATSERLYDGDLIVIRTASGRELACTPNHPILTDLGWLPARLLDIGSRVVCDGGRQWELAAKNDENQLVPTRIEDVARSFAEPGEVSATEVPLAAPDFHGDALDGDVAVIRTYRQLPGSLEPPANEHIVEPDFQGRRGRAGTVLPGEGTETEFVERANAPSGSFVGISNLSGPLLVSHSTPSDQVGLMGGSSGDTVCLQDSVNGPSGHTIPVGESRFRLSGRVGRDDPLSVRRQLARSTDRMVLRTEDPDDDLARDSELARQLAGGAAGPVFLDEVVSVFIKQFVGHVYNLQTVKGYYSANGIITHNCKCGWRPANVGESTKGQIRRQDQIQQALERSLRMSKPKKAKMKDYAQTATWAGGRAKISKQRPKTFSVKK